MKNIPQTIYLNIGDGEPSEIKDFKDIQDDVTWCPDKATLHDIPYQLKPVWHDLRKNPNDYPTDDTIVMVKLRVSICGLDNLPYHIAQYNNIHRECWEIPPSGAWSINRGNPEDNSVIAWMEIPEFKG